MLKNSRRRYGLVAVLLHWIIAVGVIGEFALGLYMTGMDYYNRMSQFLPHLHESIGILLAGAIFLRIAWSIANPRPAPGSGVGPLARAVSKLVQFCMQLLLVAIVVFGYLLSTAEGEGIPVFDWFTLPALMDTEIKGEEDIFLFLHYWLAWAVIALACLHMLGALKHHFVDRDETLRNMLGLGNTD